MKNLPDYAANMTMKEFLAWANISHTKAYKEISAGNLRAIKCGRRTLIRRTDAEAWLANLPTLGDAA
jgi:excisionase family DNA binding protein